MQQISFDDIELIEKLKNSPGRTAFIDECGNFGFDFSTEGTSKYYILCAVIVENSKVRELHEKFEKVKQSHGFRDSELKSEKIGNNTARRSRIVFDLLPIDFSVLLFVADKKEFIENSPLREYKKTFFKYLHQRLYTILYHVYPKLKIIEDNHGTSEFQQSFKKYVEENRPKYNLLNDYDFDYTDSKDELLVQLADMISGTIYKCYTDKSCPNYKDMLGKKILHVEEFPSTREPFWGQTNPEDVKYSKDIFALAMKCVDDFIMKHEKDDSYIRRMQVAMLRYLRFQVLNVNPAKYVTSYILLSILQEYSLTNVTRNNLYRHIVAPLRDEGVILASCGQGYKIPVSADDITTYLNQQKGIISPMLDRMGICRTLIKQATDNGLDVLDDAAFIRYKKYFD